MNFPGKVTCIKHLRLKPLHCFNKGALNTGEIRLIVLLVVWALLLTNRNTEFWPRLKYQWQCEITVDEGKYINICFS